MEHARAADTVERALANRPSLEELKQQNIVVTPVQAKAQALEHARAADTVERALANRPSLELQSFPLWLFVPILGVVLFMFCNLD